MNDFKIRPATIDDAFGIATVQYNGWQETYRGIIHDSYLDAMSVEKGFERWKKNLQSPKGFIDVMTNREDEVIAFTSGGKNRTTEFNCDAEIFSLYLLKKYQGLGLGKQLLIHGVTRLNKSAFKSFCVFVLAKNPTVQFYKKFNPDLEKRIKTKIAETEYDEMVLGWSDIIGFL